MIETERLLLRPFIEKDAAHVLQAIGLEERYAKGTIRVSLGKNNTTDDVDSIARALIKILK